MIGQRNLTQYFKDVADADMFPGFTILVGPEGSGRKKMCKFIARCLGAQLYTTEVSVDAIRQMISTAYKTSDPVLYLIPDADRMSPAAKNAILKVTEEPPKNARFVMTLTDPNNTLATLRSRASVQYMEPYTPAQLLEFLEGAMPTATAEEQDIVTSVCAAPGDIIKLVDTGITTFDDYVSLVVDNIAEVSASNSFKIGQKLAFKDTDKGKFDPVLFLRGFMSACVNRMEDDMVRYGMGVKITAKYLQDLRLVGVNKQSTFDMWLLDIREEWM